MSERLRDVLAAHDIIKPRGYAWPCCVCGAEFPGGGDDAHVEAAVLAWLGERLADEAIVETAALGVQRHSMPPNPSGLARAALTAVRDALGVPVGDDRGEVGPESTGKANGPENGAQRTEGER